MYGHRLNHLDPAVLEGDSGSNLAHDAMNETVLLGEDGWAKRFYPSIRSDLMLLLDDGWESGGQSTFELDATKFPSFAGSVAERLTKLNHAVEQLGWRGAALWCRNTPGGDADRHLEAMSGAAGIRYWKVDIGDPGFHLIELRDASRLPLLIEHVRGEMPTNGDWKADGRFGRQAWNSRRMEILRNTDVYRTYDVTSILSLPTTLDRLAEMLRGAEGHPEIHALLNVEDEVYLAAAMGCTMGVMRNPLNGLRPGEDADLFFNGPRQAKKRMDEVVRALRWQRIAPPFSAGSGSVAVSSEVLTDAWVFARGQTWQTDMIGHTVRQGAPAALTRNLPLPEVKTAGDKPFVVAARFPGGAVAVAAHERTQVDRAWRMTPSEVVLDVGDAPGPFGIFGDFEALTLVVRKPLDGCRVLAQDLAGDNPIDVTHDVQTHGSSLRLSGRLLRHIGLSSATPGDQSTPGLVLTILS